MAFSLWSGLRAIAKLSSSGCLTNTSPCLIRISSFGSPTRSLDEVLFGVERILEDDHVPTLGRRKVVDKLADQNPIARKTSSGWRSTTSPESAVSAQRAGRRDHRTPARCAAGLQRPLIVDLVVDLNAGPRLIPIAAFGTLHVLVLSHQRGSHRTGRDHKRFGHEGAKQKRENHGQRDRFDRLASRLTGRCLGLRRPA